MIKNHLFYLIEFLKYGRVYIKLPYSYGTYEKQIKISDELYFFEDAQGFVVDYFSLLDIEYYEHEYSLEHLKELEYMFKTQKLSLPKNNDFLFVRALKKIQFSNYKKYILNDKEFEECSKAKDDLIWIEKFFSSRPTLEDSDCQGGSGLCYNTEVDSSVTAYRRFCGLPYGAWHALRFTREGISKDSNFVNITSYFNNIENVELLKFFKDTGGGNIVKYDFEDFSILGYEHDFNDMFVEFDGKICIDKRYKFVFVSKISLFKEGVMTPTQLDSFYNKYGGVEGCL